uniref:Retrotransposon Copia-like N-terminal domain-containing protein n=1 Tax=Brassica oleracea var. oleracea TaxID=109376 RepID=A0A0D3ECM9_BRAOL
MSTVTKLSSTNYLIWNIQIKALLRGYNLPKFIDSSDVPPPEKITVADREQTNPAFDSWTRLLKLGPPLLPYLTDIILDGLPYDFKAVIDSVHARDTSISFT